MPALPHPVPPPNSVRHATGPRCLYSFPPGGGMGGARAMEAPPVFTPTPTLPRRGGGDQETSRQAHELAGVWDARGGNFLLAAVRDLPV